MTSTTYLSIDIEADGPIPGPFSMLSFGVVAFDEKGHEIGAHARNLELLPHAIQHPETMAWWAKNQEAYDRTRVDCAPPAVAMDDFAAWMHRLEGKLTVLGYPASYDFMFLYWYLMAHKAQGREGGQRVGLDYKCPFGFQALDIKTLAMIPLACDFREVGKRKMPKAWFEGQPQHTHDPLDDARGQGMLFFAVLNAARATYAFDSSANQLVNATLTEQRERIAVLTEAIRKHRDQRGDDRCWLDDRELYIALGEPFTERWSALPPPEEMLANCRRFIASRQPGGVPYVSEQREIERLRELVSVQAAQLAQAEEVHRQAETKWFGEAERLRGENARLIRQAGAE
jgi:hypothetical protein